MCDSSGLASKTIGFDYETLGTVSRHKQCQEYDHLQLFTGIDGYTFSTICRRATSLTLSP